MTIQTQAKALYDAFEISTRTNGETFYKLKDNSPGWMTDVVREAHDKMLPDDQRYVMVMEACGLIADADDVEEIEVEADTYTHDLTGWLHSRNDRVYFLTEALEASLDFKDGFQLLAYAQYLEKQEVLGVVVNALKEREETEEAA